MKRKYGYRKFKGIGLASAVIGFTLLSAPVYAESLDSGLVNSAEAASTTPQPEGRIIVRSEDGVPWELYENGYLLFKPEDGKDTLENWHHGETPWKVNYGSKIKYIGFSSKVRAPEDSSYLFGADDDSLFKPIFIDTTQIDTSDAVNMESMFHNANALTHLDVSNWDTSKVTNMATMFYGVSGLTTLNVGNWNTGNVTNTAMMFAKMSNLRTIDVSRWDTSNVTNMYSMFGDASKLETLDVNHWDISNVKNMSYMFSGLHKLTKLNLDGWTTSNVADMSYMFYNSTDIETLNIESWDMSNVTSVFLMLAQLSNVRTIRIGEQFSADGIRTLANEASVTNSDRWHKMNDKEHPYTVSDWSAAYAANPTGMAGTWVREEKVQDATLTFQGENFTPVKVKPSDTALPTLPRPSWPKQNHKFLGWSKDGRNPITREEVKPGETITLQPLWQPVSNTTTRTEAIPVTTTYRGDDNLDTGKRQETPGTTGEKRITTTYTVTSYTGELTNPVESTEIIRNMTPKVITIGTKPTSTIETIPSPKVYQADPTRARGSEDIVTQGQPGSKTTTTIYTVNPNTGQVTSTQNPPIIKQPTDTVIKVATQDKIVDTPIQPTKRYEADPTRARGEKDITTPGTPGNTRTVTTYTVNPNTGQVTEKVGQPTVTKPATDTVIKIASQDKVSKSNIVTKTTRVNKDNTKPLGHKHVDTEGSDGYTETITHYDVDPTTGNVTERIETRTVPPVERVVTEGALTYDLPTTGTADMTITLAGLAGTLVITKRKKTK